MRKSLCSEILPMVLLAAIILPKTAPSFIPAPLQPSLESFRSEPCLLPGSVWSGCAWATGGLDLVGPLPLLQHPVDGNSGLTPDPPEVQLFWLKVRKNTGALGNIYLFIYFATQLSQHLEIQLYNCVFSPHRKIFTNRA